MNGARRARSCLALIVVAVGPAWGCADDERPSEGVDPGVKRMVDEMEVAGECDALWEAADNEDKRENRFYMLGALNDSCFD